MAYHIQRLIVLLVLFGGIHHDSTNMILVAVCLSILALGSQHHG
jgi:hypothetical protein